MKNRLLEDFGDSQSAVPARPVRRVQAAAPQPAPQPRAEAAPSQAPSPAGVPEIPAHQKAGVWRSRAPVEAPAPPQPRAAQGQAFVPPRVEPGIAPSPAAEPARAAPRMSPEFASFSSREPDWSIPHQPEPPRWTERWGRKALGWTIGLAVVVAVAGTAAWMVQETQVESTLAVVADHTPAQAALPAPAVPAAAPVPEPEAEALPPLKLLPPEPLATLPVEAGSVAPQAIGAAAGTAATAAVAAPPPAKKPEAKRAQERRVAAAAPVKRTRPETKKPAPKPARERVVARAPAAPARTVSAEQPDPESPLAETLRLCRAAGYHATACLKRGCEATKFGLVCRG